MPTVPQQTEAAFRRQVIQAAKLFGWRVAAVRPVRIQRKNGQVYHETPMEADGCGWPDLFLVKNRMALALELKVGKNTTTDAQEDWLDALGRAGICVGVFYPRQWPQLEDLLRREYRE